jgi:hypothetical protein
MMVRMPVMGVAMMRLATMRRAMLVRIAVMMLMIMPVAVIAVMMIIIMIMAALGRIVRLVRGDRQFRSSVPPQPAGAIDRLRYNMI